MFHSPNTTMLRIARLGAAVGLAFWAGLLVQPAWSEERPVQESTQVNLRVDRALQAFDDPLLIRERLAVRKAWRGPRGEQPFNQQPRNAQNNFCPVSVGGGGKSIGVQPNIC